MKAFLEELLTLLQEGNTETAIEKIQEKLQPKEKQNVVWTHDCYNASKYHKNKYKHWAKLLTGVDDTKISGYAFLGDFLKTFDQNFVPKGSYVLEFCDRSATLYKVTSDFEKEEIASGSVRDINFIRETKAVLEEENGGQG